MKSQLCIIIIILFFSGNEIFGQITRLKNTNWLKKHEISGIVQDSLGVPISGVAVFLISAKDSAETSTNDGGIFIFNEINSATFQLKLSHIGYTAIIKKFFFNDVNTKLILDPIILGVKSNELKEVIVNGVPSIVYKADTVEYKASDYITIKNARLDELIRQMEGVEVGSDGSVLYLGQQVSKARLNGKDYAGGDVAQVIQNLPADIADKIQFIDDYGPQATRTGIKDGDPKKVLNITTKKEKSVGTVSQVSVGEGTNDTYNDRLFAQHLNGNSQIGLIGNVTNTTNGVSGYGNDNASNVGGGANSGNLNSNAGSGGTSTLGNVAFNYREQLSKDLQINLNYFYNRKILNSTLQSEAAQLGTSSPINTFSRNNIINTNDNHTLNIELEYTPGAKDYFLFTPIFNYSNTNNQANDIINQQGLINQIIKSNPDNSFTMPLAGADIYYQHIFEKPGRNISFGVGYLQSEQKFGVTQSDQINYLDATGVVTKDSAFLSTVFKRSKNKTFTTDLQYIEPLNKNASIRISLKNTFKEFNNTFETSTGINNKLFLIDSLTENWGYKFFKSEVASSYQLSAKRISLSVGIGLLSTMLNDLQSATNGGISDVGLHLVPIFRFQYKWSAQQNSSLYYNNSVQEPSFIQLQQVPDYSNTINTVFGNPGLKPTFTHHITATYCNYLPDQRINIAATLHANIIKDQVVSDVVQTYLLQQAVYINQTYFQNLDGNYSINSNISISKQIINRILNLEYNSTINYDYFNTLNNRIASSLQNWHFIQRFEAKIILDEKIQIYPFLAFDVFKLNNNSAPTNFDLLKTTSLNILGNFNILNRWFANVTISKNYTTGLNTVNKNPLLANLSVEREIFSAHNGRIKLQTFDLLNQNSYTNRIINPNTITDITSNALHRYFLLSLILNFEKWGAISAKNGKELKRRGDGSFIYP